MLVSLCWMTTRTTSPWKQEKEIKWLGWGERTKGCSANFIMVTQDSNETHLNYRKPKSQMGQLASGTLKFILFVTWVFAKELQKNPPLQEGVSRPLLFHHREDEEYEEQHVKFPRRWKHSVCSQNKTHIGLGAIGWYKLWRGNNETDWKSCGE